MSTLAEIIDKAGGVTKVSRELGLPVGTVSAWITRNRVPAERVISLERVTGAPRHQIRSDIYPPEEIGSEPERAA